MLKPVFTKFYTLLTGAYIVITLLKTFFRC
jgi:hypothetical protein